MTIGFDASRVQLAQRAGPENYSYNLLVNLLRLDTQNFYRLYCRPPVSSLDLDDDLPRANFELRPITLPNLWTQVGLAFDCLLRPPDVLFIPAHTIPIIRRPYSRTVVTIHDVGFQKYLEQYQYPWWRLYGGRISNYAARAASHVIAVSASTKRDLVEKLGVDDKKITVVYEGVDHQKFKVQSSSAPRRSLRDLKFKSDEVRERYGIDGDYLLFVGTVQPRKNLSRLIEAFAKARAERNASGTQLVISGKKGWQDSEIYAAPEKFGVGNSVKFIGFAPTDDIAELMRGAKCLSFPSLYEGFGLVALEAMACGCPVVASNTSSLPEVVGEAGILVDPQSVDDIAAGLATVLRMTDDERNNIVEAGLRQAAKFTWEKTAKETLKVLERTALHNSLRS